MCLVAVYKVPDDRPLYSPSHPERRLRYVILNNRDELFERGTQTPQITTLPDGTRAWGGRDQLHGGTWFGIHSSGRFAVVTNVIRAGSQPYSRSITKSTSLQSNEPISRGTLVKDFVVGSRYSHSVQEYAKHVLDNKDQFRGFALLFADCHECAYVSSCSTSADERVQDGIHVFSNSGYLDDDSWKKVSSIRRQLSDCIREDSVCVADLMDCLSQRIALDNSVDACPYKDCVFVVDAFPTLGVHAGTRTSVVALISDEDAECHWHEYNVEGSVTARGIDTLTFDRCPKLSR
jgi:uncharacterized protein with NRDE domain